MNTASIVYIWYSRVPKCCHSEHRGVWVQLTPRTKLCSKTKFDVPPLLSLCPPGIAPAERKRRHNRRGAILAEVQLSKAERAQRVRGERPASTFHGARGVGASEA